MQALRHVLHRHNRDAHMVVVVPSADSVALLPEVVRKSSQLLRLTKVGGVEPTTNRLQGLPVTQYVVEDLGGGAGRLDMHM